MSNMIKFTLQITLLTTALVVSGCIAGVVPPPNDIVLPTDVEGVVAPTVEEEPTSPEPTEQAIPTTDAPQEIDEDLAPIDAINVKVTDGPLPKVNVTMRGDFPDGCTAIDEITQSRVGDTFYIAMTTRRPADLMCTQVLVPFEETVELDVTALGAGTYTVEVNGVRQAFDVERETAT